MHLGKIVCGIDLIAYPVRQELAEEGEVMRWEQWGQLTPMTITMVVRGELECNLR